LFYERAYTKGFTKPMVKETWRQMRAYAQYGFNKAHATSYGLLAYQMAYLKTNYPVEFMVALLETASGEKVPGYITEARRLGIKLLPPDINKSGISFTKEEGKVIRFGFTQIKGIGERAAQDLLDGKPYHIPEDLVRNTTTRLVNTRVRRLLIAVGAVHSIGIEPEGNLLQSEMEYLGIPVSYNPFMGKERKLAKYINTSSNQRNVQYGNHAIIGGLIVNKREVKDKNNRRMCFLDVMWEAHLFNVTVFASMYKSEVKEMLVEGNIIVCEAVRSGVAWLMERVMQL
jgi:DNA polymerase III alpha subunit